MYELIIKNNHEMKVIDNTKEIKVRGILFDFNKRIIETLSPESSTEKYKFPMDKNISIGIRQVGKKWNMIPLSNA